MTAHEEALAALAADERAIAGRYARNPARLAAALRALIEPPNDDEREALRGVGRVMLDHEPYWNLRRCKCGAKLGDSIDWNWHLANQATIAALRRQGPVTEALETIRSSWSVIRGAQADMLKGRPDMDAMEEIALASAQIDDALEAARAV